MTFLIAVALYLITGYGMSLVYERYRRGHAKKCYNCRHEPPHYAYVYCPHFHSETWFTWAAIGAWPVHVVFFIVVFVARLLQIISPFKAIDAVDIKAEEIKEKREKRNKMHVLVESEKEESDW